MVHSNNSGQFIKVDRLVCKLDHSNPQAFIDTLLMSIGAKRHNPTLILSIIFSENLDDFFRRIDSIHGWHLNIHQNKFVVVVIATSFEEIIFELLNCDKPVIRLVSLDVETFAKQHYQWHQVELIVVHAKDLRLALVHVGALRLEIV